MKRSYIILIIFLVCLSTAYAIPSFPGAEGYGAESIGGRGGSVIEVTNLNDGGPGSLRACAGARGPRTCVFRVGGTITLDKGIRIEEPYLTIAGQTAPGGGILLRSHPSASDPGEVMKLVDGAHNIIIQYIRFRSGDTSPTPTGRGQVNLEIGAGVHDVIVDHSSFSWTDDENIDIQKNVPNNKLPHELPDIERTTIQRSIIAEGLYPHSTGIKAASEWDPERGVDGINDTRYTAIHHNLFAHNNGRNPWLASIHIKVINNLVYGWGSASVETSRETIADFIGNYYRPGPDSGLTNHWVHDDIDQGYPQVPFSDPSLYLSNNFLEPNQWDYDIPEIHRNGNPLPQSYKRFSPLSQARYPITIQNVNDVYNDVLGDVGASRRLDCDGSWISNYDAVDQRILNDVVQKTGGIIDSESEVGGYPTIASGTPCTDSDSDGMPNVWESQMGLNPNNAADRNGDLDGDGYTNLEEFLHGPSSGTNPPPPNPPPVVPPPNPPPPINPPPPPNNCGFGDLNCDGIVNVLDLVLLVRFIGTTYE